MDPSSNDYRISFFRPTTEQARRNRNMVIWLVCIWALAVFGFQIVLRILEEPVPEPVHGQYAAAWNPVLSGEASDQQIQDFAYSVLSVLSKVSLAPADREVLDGALGWSLFRLVQEEDREILLETLQQFEEVSAVTTDIRAPEYVASRKQLMLSAAKALEVPTTDIRSRILPLELSIAAFGPRDDAAFEKIPGIMDKYLIHNRSVLTDTRFLGFPFHYFYTAVFLLILFVGLCWLYCIRTDRMNVKMGIAD